MPELPEVETTRRAIAPKLLGRTIESVRVTAASYFFLTPPKELARRLTGRRVETLERHGKYLIAGLDDESRLFLHLGMTGQLFTASARSVRLLKKTKGGALTPEAQAKFISDVHTHLALHFADAGEEVLFRDVRKFGKVRWLPRGKSDPRLDKLGPDALTVTGPLLYEATRTRKTAIKTVLLDQEVIAGVGNIYADEALFRAGIRPRKSAKLLTRAQCDKLAQEVRAVLLRSIETGGSSISDYVRPDGSDGGYQNERKVYGRKDEPCSVCSTPIVRIVLAARSTHYCPHCQR
ncbi:MAG TPA: bifunctional DNA-formamidopyrimidine glycosylase/DNA-(apurinic or apyrimidinic site) lyase [Polyangiales bacterium]